MKLAQSFCVFLALLLAGGCATRPTRDPPVACPPQPPPALTLAQIKEMSAKGVSDDTILNALRASRAVYQLTADDVQDLQNAKVSKAVIDYLLSTPQLYPAGSVRYRYYYYYPVFPYWWHHDWHWDWHHDFHHDFHHGYHH